MPRLTILTTLASIVLLALLTQANSARRSAFEEKLMSRKFSMVGISGTDIGGGYASIPIEEEEQWCQTQITYLQRSLHKARRKLNKTSDHYRANKILVKGLNRIAESSGAGSHVFTRIAVETGLELANAWGVMNPTQDMDTHRFNHYALVKYYEFVIERVSTELDMQSYIPYIKARRHNRGHGGGLRSQLEKRFIRYANLKLDWINRYLARIRTDDPDYGEMIAVPRGSARNYLAAAKIIALSTAQDLANSLWEFRFSCAIDDLMVISESLSCYMQPNCQVTDDDLFLEEFDDNVEALNFTFFSIQKIRDSIKQVSSCEYERDWEDYTDTNTFHDYRDYR